MKRLLWILTGVIVMAQPVMSQDDSPTMFLKLDGVSGGSEAPSRSDWIDVESFLFEAARLQNDSPSPGPTLYSDMQVVAQFEPSAQTVLEKMVDGAIIPNGHIERTAEFPNNRREVVEEWNLKNVLVSEFDRTNNDTISYSFAFQQGEMCYIERRANGNEWARRCTEFDAAGYRYLPDEEDETVEETPVEEINTYLQVDGVRGQSQANNRTDWIDVQSFQFDASRQLMDGQFPGTMLYSGMEVVAAFDRASQMVFDEMVTGDTISSVKVERTAEFLNNRHETVEEWTLNNALVTGFERTNGSTIAYTFAFEEGQLCYIERVANGNQAARHCTKFEALAPTPLQAGDADQDFDFDQLDLVRVQQGGKYLSADPATWGEGDWNGAPGGGAGAPPAGDGRFDTLDIIAALQTDLYLQGPYAARQSESAAAGVGNLVEFPMITVPEPVSRSLMGMGMMVLIVAARIGRRRAS